MGLLIPVFGYKAICSIMCLTSSMILVNLTAPLDQLGKVCASGATSMLSMMRVTLVYECPALQCVRICHSALFCPADNITQLSMRQHGLEGWAHHVMDCSDFQGPLDDAADNA